LNRNFCSDKRFYRKNELKELEAGDIFEDKEEQEHLKAVVSAFLNYQVFSFVIHYFIRLIH